MNGERSKKKQDVRGTPRLATLERVCIPWSVLDPP
jgi:hypothetical protein